MSYQPIEIGKSADLAQVIEAYGYYEGSFEGRKIVIVQDRLSRDVVLYHLAQKTNSFYLACLYVASFFTRINFSLYTARKMNQNLQQDICSYIESECLRHSRRYFNRTFCRSGVFTPDDTQSELHKKEIDYIHKGLKKLHEEIKGSPAIEEQWEKVDAFVSEIILYSKNNGYHPDYGFDSVGNYKSGMNKHHFLGAGYTLEDLKFTSADMAYNKAGYDRDGYDREGYNLAGFNKEGLNKAGKTSQDYLNYYSYASDWIYQLHKDNNGVIRNEKGFDRAGYDREGYDICGFNSQGLNKSGCTRQDYLNAGLVEAEFMYNLSFFRRGGYDSEGYDLYGFNASGRNKSGYKLQDYLHAGISAKDLKTLNKDAKGVLRNAAGYDRWGYKADGKDLGGKQRRRTHIRQPDPAATSQPKKDKPKYTDAQYLFFALFHKLIGQFHPDDDPENNPYYKHTGGATGGGSGGAGSTFRAGRDGKLWLPQEALSFVSSIETVINYPIPQDLTGPLKDFVTLITTSTNAKQLLKLREKKGSVEDIYSLSLALARELFKASESTSKAEIKKAYYRLALKIAPDKVPEEQRALAIQLIQCVNTAATLLEIK